MKTTRRFTRGEVAFTLVEVLVAEAIFLILLLIVMQVIFGALQTTTAQKKRMDELGDARQSLDRLSLDWSARVRRGDTLASFSRQTASATNAANAQISFLSQVQAYSGARHLSWVSYGINNILQVTQGSQTNSAPGLERGILGYNFSPSDATGAANPVLSLPGTIPTATVTFDPLANTVFRFDYCFLRPVPSSSGTGPFTINNPTDTSNPSDPNVNLNSTNIIGIVVAVASIDQQSRQILNQAQLVAMGNALPITDGQTPQATWLTALNNGTFATVVKGGSPSVPASVANAVHVYQRIIYVND